MELTDENIDDNLNLINCENQSLVIGYTDSCHRCKELIDNLNKHNIIFNKINLQKNENFSELIAIKYQLTSINVPLITIYKDGKFIKKIPNKFSVTHILLEIKNL
jgi:hypothetical protein